MLSRFMTRREQVVLAFVAAAIILGSGVLVWLQQENSSMEPVSEVVVAPIVTTPSPVPAVFKQVVEEDSLIICVQGSVVSAGVYEMTSEQRVNDAIEAAGGILSLGDTDGLNLAAKLVDGTTLFVPKMERNDGTGNPVESTGIEKNHPGYLLASRDVMVSSTDILPSNGVGLVNLNTASQAQLEALPGIGPVYAKAIIVYRSRNPFRTIEEIQNVQGIGEKRYESIRDQITVH